MIPRFTPSRRGIAISLTVGIPVSALFLWLAVRGSRFDEVGRTLRVAEPQWLIAAGICLGLMYLSQSFRWRRIARASLRRRQVLGMVLSGLAVNNVVPGRIGDLLRARWISQAAGFPGGRGFASVILDRGGDLLILATAVAVGAPFLTDDPWADRILVGAVVLAFVFLGVLIAARVLGGRTRDRAPAGRLREFLRGTLHALAEPMSLRFGSTILALSAVAWICWSLAAMAAARSVGIDLSLVEALVLAGIVNLGVVIPSSPGYLGTYQWLVVSMLEQFDVDDEPALAFSILFYALWFIPTTFVGGALLLRRRRRELPGAVHAESRGDLAEHAAPPPLRASARVR